jgi:4-alpha-glucanotransferase
VHAFLASTPSPLIGLALGDLTGERDPVNLPGVPMEGYPSWSRRMDTAVEDLSTSSHVREGLTPFAK